MQPSSDLAARATRASRARPRAAALLLAVVVLSARPLAAQVSLVSEAITERDARPGQQCEGAVLVHNDGAAPVQARVYQTDYEFHADGTSLFGAAGSSPRSNAKWVHLAGATISVLPGETARLPYTVTVPSTASLTGSYWSLVMVESAGEPAELTPGRRTLGLQATTRFATQIVTHMTGTGAPRIELAHVAAHSAPAGQRSLDFDLSNAGDLARRVELVVELFAPDGTRVAHLTRQRGLLFPGSSLHQQLPLGKLPAGAYTALITADAGTAELAAAQLTLRF